MENVSLEVVATCGQPLELRGQKVRDVQVFTSCPQSSSAPGDEVKVDLKKPKPGLSKAAGIKTRPAKPKTKQPKTKKSQPPRKSAKVKVTENKKTL